MSQPTPPDVLLRFVHVSDTHISADPSYSHPDADYPAAVGAHAAVRAINTLPFTPDFVLHTGDVAYDPDASAYLAAREILSGLRAPVHYLVGNHDDREALQRVLCGQPAPAPRHSYQFECGGVQCIMLDSNAPAPGAGGALGPQQLDWLRALCAAPDARPMLVAVHHNALPVGSPFLDSFMRLVDGEALHQALLPAARRLRGVFFGHIHQPTETWCDGILYCSAPSTWYQLHCDPGSAEIRPDRGAPPGFSVVTVLRDRTFVRRHRFTIG